jgi:hypothetical protein
VPIRLRCPAEHHECQQDRPELQQRTLGGSELDAPERLKRGQAATMITGRAATCSSWRGTRPTVSSPKSPCPRVPTTIASAPSSRARATSAGIGCSESMLTSSSTCNALADRRALQHSACRSPMPHCSRTTARPGSWPPRPPHRSVSPTRRRRRRRTRSATERARPQRSAPPS